MAAVLNLGAVDTPVFNKEAWKLFTIAETELDFLEGLNANEDRYLYDMPGDITSVSYLHNTIFSPEVLLEEGVDFDVLDDDGYVRFRDDPFREYQDTNGKWMPLPGVAWRTVQKSVGNTLENTAQVLYGTEEGHTAYDDGVRRGDTLRILAHKGTELTSGLVGTITKVPAGYLFLGTGVEQAKVGDIIHVYGHAGGAGHADDAYRDFYIVKRIFTNPPVSNQVELEPLSVHNTVPSGSIVSLYWRLYSAIYFETWRDHEVDYIDQRKLVGSAENPYPLDIEESFVYSIVRTPVDSEVFGTALNYVTDAGAYPSPDLPYAPPNTPSNPPPQYVTNLGYRHIVQGSVKVYAKKWIGTDTAVDIEEDVDYTVDYLNGKIIQLTYWLPTSYGSCNFEYMSEVYFSGSGDVESLAVGNVKQLSYWAPEVVVDRFTLWYNYGSLLNRFDASSEAYKSFLLGIMYLYATGPILQRIEAALNVAAGYSVVKNEGEILLGYDNGEISEGSLATLVQSTSTVVLDVSEYVLSELDVGGYIIFENPVNAANKGKFRILGVFPASNSALLETNFSLVDESLVGWLITHTYTKIVTTDQRTYTYPYNVPIRSDVIDDTNFGLLVFNAFEPLTAGFTVTDYIEDPTWWHDKNIPQILWPLKDTEEEPAVRRRAAIKLYEHIVGPEDYAEIGDPGLFIGADNWGNILNPNDNSGPEVPGIGDPVSIHRHNAAFVLFDQALKLHMFYISISPDLELEPTFKIDLEELILIAKPSYTYPIVDISDVYIDNVVLTEVFAIPEIAFDFPGEDQPNSIQLAENWLRIGDTAFPWNIGEFFRYTKVTDVMPNGPHPVPIPVGYIFDVGDALAAGVSPVTLNITGLTRTADGKMPVEGRDYTVDWLRENPAEVANPNAWRVVMLTECTGATPGFFADCTAEVSHSSYDTTLGDTPLIIVGGNPWYIRRTALNPDAPTFAAEWVALRTEHIDRPVQLTIVDGGGSYTYP